MNFKVLLGMGLCLLATGCVTRRRLVDQSLSFYQLGFMDSQEACKREFAIYNRTLFGSGESK